MAQHLDTSAIVEGTESISKKLEKCNVLKSKIFKEDSYEVDDSFIPADSVNEVHTTEELLKFAESGKVEIDARVIAKGGNKLAYKRLNTKEFIESSKIEMDSKRMRESALDAFSYDIDTTGNTLVGNDFTPIFGGPFYKQLYIYDYLRMHSASFFAYNHDPMARQIVAITRDFTLGRGWRADSKNRIALTIWEAFVEANDLYNKIDSLAVELSIYGETMIWWLPNNETKIGYRLSPGQKVPTGIIPRIRLIDPSCIWEIVTYPEDITRVLYYQWVSPTQYQIYTGRDQGQSVPTSKFIYQQIPAQEVMHYKVNSVSNEKRGRSDLFPVLGYLKRLRDSVNYSIIGMQKNMAWSVDTTVDGSQSDLDAYVQSQQDLGSIPPAGSEFVHSKKIERKYLSNEGGRGATTSPAFEWCMSMIAAGTGIPVNYFGTHLSGAQTRASALVATEPVTKKFEKRRLLYEQILQDLSQKVLKQFGVEGTIEFTFPELVSQDRSTKIKDVIAAELQGYISKERAASIVAKELDISDFDPKKDLSQPQTQPGQQTSPLTSPPTQGAINPSALTSDEKKKVSDNDGF